MHNSKTMNSPKVSFIVAVYNVEQYIHRCVESLLGQTYHNIEVVLVDDGSIDKSSSICDEYALKDKRVKVIHKENGGVSSARQVGLDASTGDWVIHADPDDYVELDMVERLLDAGNLSNVDIVTCDYFQNGRITRNTYCDREDLLLRMLESRTHVCLWNTLIKHSFIVQHQLRFDPIWLCHSEDVFFILKVLLAGANATHVSQPLYHYITRDGSLVVSRSEKALKSEITIIQILEKIIDASLFDNLYWRKRYVLIYAYEGRWFQKVSTLYPEIRSRLINGANDDWLSIDSQLARCMKYPPALVWFSAKVYSYMLKIFR